MSRLSTAKPFGAAVLIAGFAALAVLLAMLGDWQLRRAEENRSVERRYAQASSAQALQMPPAGEDLGEFRYRRLHLAGRYVPGTHILIDNRTYGGRAGYEVLTPFEPAGSDRWILVNRGWVRAHPDRRQLPEVALDTQPGAVTGRMAAFPAPGISLGEPPVERLPEGLLRLSFPTAEMLERELGEPVLAYQLLLDAEEPNGFVREWRPRAMAAERNVGYAVQWFAFAAGSAGLALFFAYRMIRPAAGRR